MRPSWRTRRRSLVGVAWAEPSAVCSRKRRSSWIVTSDPCRLQAEQAGAPHERGSRAVARFRRRRAGEQRFQRRPQHRRTVRRPRARRSGAGLSVGTRRARRLRRSQDETSERATIVTAATRIAVRGVRQEFTQAFLGSWSNQHERCVFLSSRTGRYDGSACRCSAVSIGSRHVAESDCRCGAPPILIANHESVLDPLVLGCAIERDLRFLAKAELWRYRPVGWAMDALRGIRVDRGRGDRDALAEARRALEAGEAVVIFPQGAVRAGRPMASRRSEARAGHGSADRCRFGSSARRGLSHGAALAFDGSS